MKEKTMSEFNLERAKCTVSEFTGEDYSPSSETDSALLFLIASIYTGPNYIKILKITDLSARACRRFARTARKQGIWVGHRIAAGDWYHEKTGGTAFLLDGMVTAGLLEKRKYQ